MLGESTMHDVVHREHIPILRSFIFRLIGGGALFAFVLLIGNTVWSYTHEKAQVLKEFTRNTMAIGLTLAPSIPLEHIEEFIDNTSVSHPEYQEVHALLQQAQISNGLEEDQMYLMKVDPHIKDTYRFVVMLSDKSFVGEPYTPPVDMRDIYAQVQRGVPVVTPLYTDQNGSFVASFIPLHDASHHTNVFLVVKRDIYDYLQILWTNTIYKLLIDSLIFSVWVVFGLVVYRQARRKFDFLLDATVALQEGQYEHRVPIESKDEFSVLARALNLSLAQLGERLEMRKFLPKHTQNMIAYASEQQSRVELSMARYIEAVIMETDIRGFTALTEKLTPQGTIRLINQFIAVQAEIILKEEYAGSIDKYMGDAVLVIFEGTNKEVRAYNCALHIQQAIAELNKNQGTDATSKHIDMNIGIGLSTGRVIMGNMGCEERMEHTVIGSTVNLAARLCSIAREGEVVIQQSIMDTIGDIGEVESVTVKGFSEAIPIRRLSLMDVNTQPFYRGQRVQKKNHTT